MHRFITILVQIACGRLSPNQQPDHTADQADGSKGCENPQIDQCDTGLFDEVAYRIPSRGETGATHDADFSLSEEKNPANLGVNLNGAARARSLRNKYSVNSAARSARMRCSLDRLADAFFGIVLPKCYLAFLDRWRLT